MFIVYSRVYYTFFIYESLNTGFAGSVRVTRRHYRETDESVRDRFERET